MKTHLFSSQLLKRGEIATILIIIALVVAAISAYLGSHRTLPVSLFLTNPSGSYPLEKSR